MGEKKGATALQQTVTFMMVMFMILFMALFGSHLIFQQRIVAVMQYTSAQELGLLPTDAKPSPFDPKRIWIAKLRDGRFEFRSAWPIIGTMPFDIFGNGTTDTDLLAACVRLGDSTCRRT